VSYFSGSFNVKGRVGGYEVDGMCADSWNTDFELRGENAEKQRKEEEMEMDVE
jgi:hypothetical protein